MDDYRELIQQFNRLFAYLLGAENNIKSNHEKTIKVEDYYFKMQKSIIEQYSKTYFKRVKAENVVEEFLYSCDSSSLRIGILASFKIYILSRTGDEINA